MTSVHTRRGAPAAFFPQASVESGAGILLDAGAYKLDAGRRTAPGDVELHEHAVDVMHVIRGSATVVTGGELRDARDVGPGEIRARPSTAVRRTSYPPAMSCGQPGRPANSRRDGAVRKPGRTRALAPRACRLSERWAWPTAAAAPRSVDRGGIVAGAVGPRQQPVIWWPPLPGSTLAHDRSRHVALVERHHPAVTHRSSAPRSLSIVPGV